MTTAKLAAADQRLSDGYWSVASLTTDAWYTWYTEAVASRRIAVANGRIFPFKSPDPRPFASAWVRLRPFATRLAEGSIPGASTLQARVTAGLTRAPRSRRARGVTRVRG